MSTIRTYPLPNSAILRLNSERKYINVAPSYQRNGDIWTREKKMLLIDSILNDYDIPKLYFHALSPTQKKKTGGKYDYAIIDGRQRLETIWSFIDDEFPLSEDFVYFADRELSISSRSYSEIAKENPRLKIRFDSYTLPIVCVETEDIELIEDMFSRLNEAVPLNAAEKRGAIGGPMAKAIKDLSEHVFFTDKVHFTNGRFRFRELSARLLYIEFSRRENGRIFDTKKPYLDDMVRRFKDGSVKNLKPLRDAVSSTLDLLLDVFTESDDLLRSQGVIPVFYLVAQEAMKSSTLSRLKRTGIEEFFSALQENRRLAEADIANANFEWLEFDRMSQQGTNDAASIRERVRILAEYLRIVAKNLDQPAAL